MGEITSLFTKTRYLPKRAVFLRKTQKDGMGAPKISPPWVFRWEEGIYAGTSTSRTSMVRGIPLAARASKQPAMASRMLSRASASVRSARRTNGRSLEAQTHAAAALCAELLESAALGNATRNRRALRDEHPGFVSLNGDKKLHTWILPHLVGPAVPWTWHRT
jgi:hypothetical protein